MMRFRQFHVVLDTSSNFLTLYYTCIIDIDPNADYPPILVTTSTRDDRVHPGHARKFVKVRTMKWKCILR